jgi:hypothetical protein
MLANQVYSVNFRRTVLFLQLDAKIKAVGAEPTQTTRALLFLESREESFYHLIALQSFQPKQARKREGGHNHKKIFPRNTQCNSVS